MDISVKVEERRSDLRRMGELVRTLALIVIASCATACGGGGGGGDGDGGGGGGPPPTGTLSVTVVDESQVAVSGASVAVTGVTNPVTTGSTGTATLNSVPAGNASVTVSRESFVTRTVSQTITASQTATLTVVLSRTTRASGGVVTTRVQPGGIGSQAETLEFRIQVVVVDAQSASIETLTPSDFRLLPCTPDPATTETNGADKPDCVRTGNNVDVPYTVLGPGAALDPFKIPGKVPPDHYAAALLFDQSRSITQTDPTDARLFSAKEFLANLGSNGDQDRVVVAAFATDIAANNGTCLLQACPEEDVTIYPYNPPTAPQFTSDGASYVATIDSFAGLEGGGTPLYSSINRMLNFTNAANTGLPSEAVVVFTDGRDETCGNPTQCRTARSATIDLSVTTGVKIFTIGLAGEVDGIALAELADGGRGIFLFAEDAAQLIPIYGSLGNLLSGSLTTYQMTFRIQAAAGTFAIDNAVRGILEVTSGSDLVRIPFIVRIF